MTCIVFQYILGVVSEYNVKIDNYFVWCDEEVYGITKYSSHAHAFYQMVFVPRGQLKYSILNREIVLNEGDFLIISPGLIHAPVGKQNPDSYKSLEIKLYLTPELELAFTAANLKKITSIKRKNVENISRLLLAVIKEWRMKLPGYDRAIHGQLEYLFILLGRESNFGSKKEFEKDVSLSENRKRRIAEEIKVFINGRYDKNISFGIMARDMCISHSYLSEVFKEKYGISPVEYLNTLRLDKAKELMKISEFNFSQIAENIGYQNVYYFSRIFKKKTGVAPSEYRRMLNEYMKKDKTLKIPLEKE